MEDSFLDSVRMVQAVMWVVGNSRWSFIRSPAAHLLLCSLVPIGLWISTGVHWGVGDPCSSIYFISVVKFFRSVWFSFIFYNSLLNFSMCSCILFLSLWSIFMIMTLNSSLGRLRISTWFFWGLILFLHLKLISNEFWNESSSFCLILCLFLVLGRSGFVSRSWRSGITQDTSMEPNTELPPGHQSYLL